MKAVIKKYLEGKASHDEMLDLLSWLDHHGNYSEFVRIRNGWKGSPDVLDSSPDTLFELDKFKSKILNEQDVKIKRLKVVQSFYKYAAVFLLLFTAGSLFFYNSDTTDKQQLVYNTVLAENGQISKAVLPDQSVVWLNSGSSLKYDNRFGLENRNIELTGQAYFDVTKNRDLPLVVSCGKINVKVLGTRFTAETYPEDPEINVVLVEGSVELTDANNKNAFASLCPNEMLVYNKHEDEFKISKVVAEKFTSWRDGVIHIYDQPLADAVIKLQKRYNQQIVLEKGLEKYKVTFSVRNENFDAVLDMLLSITPAEAYQNGEVIYLKKK